MVDPVSMTLVKALPLLAVSALFASAASAQTPAGNPSGPAGVGGKDAPADETELIPAAEDTLGGHFKLAASGLVAFPFGKLDSERDFSDKASTGFGASADLGFGLSRSVVAGISAQYVAFSAASDCSRCDPQGFGLGAFVRYHLVQGVRFDPWTSIGVGYRFLNTGQNKYSGIDWLRFAVGGDWYALSQFAFGPYFELDLGSFLRTPDGSDSSVYATANLGLRLALDFPGK